MERNGMIKGSSGFSLLEVMIAMTILLVGLLGVVGLFETGVNALGAGNKRTIASHLAENKMEEIRSSNLRSLADGEDFPSPGMTRRWTISQSVTRSRMWIARVTILWKEGGDKDRALTLKSLIFL